MNGLCTGHDDPDLWFSDTVESSGSGRLPATVEYGMVQRAVQALSICSNCPITDDCLAEGMKDENIDNGIWGGKLSGERIALSRTNIRSKSRLNKIAFARRVRSLV